MTLDLIHATPGVPLRGQSGRLNMEKKHGKSHSGHWRSRPCRSGRTYGLLKTGKSVRAMVRNEDERAQALRDLGAEVVVGDLLDLDSMHRVIAGCETMYFGLSVSDAYLAAAVNAAAVAKHHGVKAFINMSQMTLSQMSITETTPSPQHKGAELVRSASRARAADSVSRRLLPDFSLRTRSGN